MVDEGDPSSTLVVDASPLIYLAKLKAMDVFRQGRRRALVTEGVLEETTRPALIYSHPDAVSIESAIAHGDIFVTSLSEEETAFANSLVTSAPGLGLGESQVLAVAHERNVPAVVFERRGQQIARGHSIELIDTVELLFDGTPRNDLLEERIRLLADLVSMRVGDFEQLRSRIRQRRVG